MRYITPFIGTVVALLIFPLSTAFTQTSGINYQAVLTQNGSVVANSSVSVRFTVLTNGSVRFQEIHNTSSSGRGEIAAIIGQGLAESGTFDALDWSMPNLRLRVEIDLGNGFTEISNKPFQSVPYSLIAERVRNLPAISLESLQDVRLDSVSTGDVLKWNGSQWVPAVDQTEGESLAAGQGIQISNGQIRNTGDTDATDDLTKGSTAGGDLGGSFPNPRVQALHGRPVDSIQPENNQILKWDGNAWRPGQDLSSFWSRSENNRLFYLDGPVGIGTSAPGAKLHVKDGDILIEDTFPVLTLNGSSSNKIISFKQGNTDQASILFSNGIGLRASTGPFAVERSWLLSNQGNMGIGVADPAEKLHVGGGILLGNTGNEQEGILRWDGDDFLGFKDGQWVSLTTPPAPPAEDSPWEENGNDVFYSKGKVGIGTKSPVKLLTLSRPNQATSYQMELRNEGTITNGNFDGIAFTQGATGGTELGSIQLHYRSNGQPNMGFNLRNDKNVLFLEAGGNVGVNTSNPGVDLDVNGNFRASGEIRRPQTGTANLVPIAYGNISSSGKINAGSGNYTVTRQSAGAYEIDIQGENNIFFEDYIVLVSLAGEAGFSSYSSAGGKLRVKTYNLIGVVIASDRHFSFVVYKP